MEREKCHDSLKPIGRLRCVANEPHGPGARQGACGWCYGWEHAFTGTDGQQNSCKAIQVAQTLITDQTGGRERVAKRPAANLVPTADKRAKL